VLNPNVFSQSGVRRSIHVAEAELTRRDHVDQSIFSAFAAKSRNRGGIEFGQLMVHHTLGCIGMPVCRENPSRMDGDFDGNWPRWGRDHKNEAKRGRAQETTKYRKPKRALVLRIGSKDHNVGMPRAGRSA
jgi:hypothetical protein